MSFLGDFKNFFTIISLENWRNFYYNFINKIYYKNNLKKGNESGESRNHKSFPTFKKHLLILLGSSFPQIYETFHSFVTLKVLTGVWHLEAWINYFNNSLSDFTRAFKCTVTTNILKWKELVLEIMRSDDFYTISKVSILITFNQNF